VVRGQWSPARRDTEIRAAADRDGGRVTIWLEQESGVAGKDRTNATMRALAGYNVHAEGVTGAKANRADPFAAQAEAGNVRMVQGPWNHAFLEELTGFPAGAHDDQVDAASGAFNKLAEKRVIRFRY
jgi:predicted phage terminase large subunit-like protein